jgi:hypothetical protein
MGQWLSKYGESIYRTRGGPYKPGHWGVSTRRDNEIFLHITQDWPGGELTLPALPAKIKKWVVLTGGEAQLSQSGEGLNIRMDKGDIDPFNTIIKISIDSDSMALDPIDTLVGHSLTTDAIVTASSSSTTTNAKGAADTIVNYHFESGKLTKHFGEESRDKKHTIKSFLNIERSPEEVARIKKLVRNHRGHFWRYWEPKKGDQQPWVSLSFGREVEFQRVNINELYEDIRGYEFQIKNDGEWKTIHTGKRIESLSLQLPEPVKTQEVRLLITKLSEDLPKISKFDVF